MAAFAGGDDAVRYAKKTDVAVSAIVEPLHQQRDGPLVVIAHRGEAGSVAGHQHQGVAPGGEHRFVDAGKTEQHHAVNIAPGEHAEMLLHQRRGELALHHNRIVTLLIKGGQHGLHGKVFRQRIETGDDNRHHFIALAAHGAGGTGRRETVLLHHRFDALAGPFADPALVVKDAGYRRFPYAA